jgi:hypothetical protein
MVWQLEVEPGAQTFTLTVGILMTPFTPCPTVIGTVFAAVAAIGCWVGLAGSEPPFIGFDELLLELELLSPPPPHAASADTSATATTARTQPLSFTPLCMVRIVRPRHYWMSEPLTPAGSAGGNQA